MAHPTQCTNQPQEVADGKRIMCASVVLNGDPGMVQNRIANAVYDACRAGNSVLPNFPSYDPVIQSLRDNCPSTNDVNYKVCVSKPNSLVVLQSFARRWIEYEDTKEDANRLIKEHNEKFNVDGDFMEDDERIGVPNMNEQGLISF